MTGTALDTLKVSAVFDINAEFRSVMHELGLSPEDTGVVVLAYPFDSAIQLNHLVQLGRAKPAGHSVWPRSCLADLE